MIGFDSGARRIGLGNTTTVGLGSGAQNVGLGSPTQYVSPTSSGYSGVLAGTPNYSAVGRNNTTSAANTYTPPSTNTSASSQYPSVPGGVWGSYGSDPFQGMTFAQAQQSFYGPNNQYQNLSNALPSQGMVNNFNLQNEFNSLWQNHQDATQGNTGLMTALPPSLNYDQFYNSSPLTSAQSAQMQSALGPNATLVPQMQNNHLGMVQQINSGPYSNPFWNATNPASQTPFSQLAGQAGMGSQSQSPMFSPLVSQLYGGNPFGLLSQYGAGNNMGSIANLINQIQALNGGGLTSSQFGNGFSPALTYSALNPLFFGQGGGMMPFSGGGGMGGFNPMQSLLYPQFP